MNFDKKLSGIFSEFQAYLSRHSDKSIQAGQSRKKDNSSNLDDTFFRVSKAAEKISSKLGD